MFRYIRIYIFFLQFLISFWLCRFFAFFVFLNPNIFFICFIFFNGFFIRFTLFDIFFVCFCLYFFWFPKIFDRNRLIIENGHPVSTTLASDIDSTDLFKTTGFFHKRFFWNGKTPVKSTALCLPFSDQENNRIVFSALFWLSHNSEYFCFSIQHSYILNMYLDAANGISQFYFCKPCILHLLSIYIFINISHKTMIICHPSRPPQTSIFWCDYMLVLWLICKADISALCITEL